MDIEITPKKSEGVERQLQISVPAAAVRDAEERAARRYASQVRMPGFRPGKAPAAMVRKRFAAEIRQEALESLVKEAYQQAVDREQLKPISQPHVHDLKFGDGEPLTFELHLEVRPEITLARTSGFRVVRPAHQVTDEMVNDQLAELREERANWAPAEDRPAPGDMVTVLLATADDSGELPEGKEYRLVLGSGQAIPAIEEAVMEALPGETIERPVKWPDDFPDETQRGKSKVVRVELRDIKRKTLPDLDDALAREVGDFDSLDALANTVRGDLERHLAREGDSSVRQQLIEQVIAANAFEVPSSWVRQLIGAYGDAYKIPAEDQEKFAGEFRPLAERQVRRDLIIDTIAAREKLVATEADIDDRIAEIGRERNTDPGKVYASLQKAGRLREIERSITEDKVFKYLLEANTVE